MNSFAKFATKKALREGVVAPTLVVLKKHSVTDAGEVLYELKSPKKRPSKSQIVLNPELHFSQ
jgi:hypothetical protein